MLQIGGKLDKDSPSCMLICSRKKNDLLLLKYSFQLQCKCAHTNSYNFIKHLLCALCNTPYFSSN